MELILFPLLYTKSRKALTRTKHSANRLKRYPYQYEPRGDLLNRLARQTGMSKAAVREQLIKERKYLLSKQ